MWFKIEQLAQENKNIILLTLIVAPEKFSYLLGSNILISNNEIIESPKIKEINLEKHWVKYLAENLNNLPCKKEFSDENGTWAYYLEAINNKKKALIVGAGHVGEALSPILNFIGFEVSVLDDRPEFLNNIKNAKNLICLPFAEIYKLANNYEAVIIVTRGHANDLIVIKQILKKQLPQNYLGMIGSRKRTKEMFELLIEAGFSQELIKNVHAPIGLDIGAQTPEEIAISISGEIIKFFSNR